MEVRVPRFSIPIVNEMFGTAYSFEDDVELLYSGKTNVYNSFRIRSRSMDSRFKIRAHSTDGEENSVSNEEHLEQESGEKRYHPECESNPNGEIALRLFEYDWLNAMSHSHIRKEREKYVIRLQNSGLLYLRSNKNTPREFVYKLLLPGGTKAVISFVTSKE